MISVSNASPLIGLAHAKSFDLLQSLFQKVYVPQKIYDEVVAQAKGRVGASEVMQAISEGWMEVKKVWDRKAVAQLMKGFNLDRGETEAIQLAVDLKVGYIPIEERGGKRCVRAIAPHLVTTGAAGVIVFAKKQGITPEAKNRLTLLLNAHHINQTIYADALKKAGERP